jgi:hypothetical protein
VSAARVVDLRLTAAEAAVMIAALDEHDMKLEEQHEGDRAVDSEARAAAGRRRAALQRAAEKLADARAARAEPPPVTASEVERLRSIEQRLLAREARAEDDEEETLRWIRTGRVR